MEYRAYLQEIDKAADATGGSVVSLAGGYFGVQLSVDGTHVVLALDLDSDQGWIVWREDEWGERCCDAAEEILGACSLSELHSRALAATSGHTHG